MWLGRTLLSAQPSPASSVNTSRVASVHLNTSHSSVLCGSVSLGAGLSLLLSSDCGWKYRSCLGSCQDNTGKQFSVQQPLTNSRRTLQRIWHMALMVVFSDPGGGGVKGQPRASSAISHAMTLSHPPVLHAMLTPPQPSAPGLGPIRVLPHLRGSAMAVAPDEHRRPL